MLALSLSFTDDWIIRWFGSYLQAASITWLSYAKTLMRVPLGIVGQGVGVASFPFLAQLYSEKKLEELNDILNSTLKAMFLLLLPISALTIAESQPLVHLVFSHTRMREPDLAATAATLNFFSIGLFAWGAQYILARGFYATRDTITPAVVGTASTLLNLPLYWLLVRQEQHLGLALASSLGIIAYTIVLFLLLNRRTANRGAGSLVQFFVKVTVISILVGVAGFKLAGALGSSIGWQSTSRALAVLVIVTSAGVVLAALLAKLFRIDEVDQCWGKLRAFARKRFSRAGSESQGETGWKS